jgi:hypothetical protein
LVFGETLHISSSDLVCALTQIEEAPWGDLNGRPLDARRLAFLLKPYEIRPKSIRINDKTLKGYTRADFQDAWNRYLPLSGSLSVTSVTPNVGQIQNEDRNYPSQTPAVTPNVTDNSQSYPIANVTLVTDKSREKEEKTQKDSRWEMEIR